MHVQKKKYVNFVSISRLTGKCVNWSKTAFVNTVYKLFYRLFSYTRVNVKFDKTSFVNTADTVRGSTLEVRI